MRIGVSIAITAAVSMIVGSAVDAAERSWVADRGWYVGAGVGRSDISGADCSDADHVQSVSSCDAPDADSTSERLFVGYQFIRYVALEVGHVWIGEFTETARGPGASLSNCLSPGTVTSTLSLRPRAFTLQGVGILPIGNGFGGLARLGIAYWRVPTDVTSLCPNGSTTSDSYDNYDIGLDVGIGVSYDVSKRVTARLEFEGFDCCQYDMEWRARLMWLSVVYRFK